MSINIGTEETPVMVNVALSGGMVDAYVRATDEDTFLQAALVAGLMYEITETLVDEEGNEFEHGTGEYAVAKGVEIYPIGPVVITPAVTDEEGNVTTPAAMDTRHHVNFRMGEPAISVKDSYGVLEWEKWAMAWTIGGEEDTQINNAEEGKVILGVSLIDPDTINSRSRRVL